MVYHYDKMGNRVTETTTGSPLEVGVVAVYPFSEGTGTSTADMSGHGNDGTLQGASWTTDGKVGNALSFDGVNDYVQVAHDEDLNVTNTFTLAAWINTDLSQPGTLLSKDGVGGDPTGAYNIYIGKTPSEVPYIWYETNNVDGLYAYNGLTPNAWHHVVVTFDAAASPRMHIYVDGIERSSGDVTAPSALSYDLLIGRRGWSGEPRHFKGKIDEVKIYNVALSEQDILALYKSYSLVASYPFSEGSGSTTADESGNGHDGTLQGATWTTDGKEGNALSFDGVDDYVDLGTDAALRIGQADFTIAAWGKHAATSNWSILAADRNGGYAEGWLFGLTASGNLHCGLQDAAVNYKFLTSSQTYDDGQWHHFACSWEPASQTLTLYVDGAEITSVSVYESGTVGSATPSTHVNIGRQPSNHNHWEGFIDEVQLYQTILSASDIQDLYQSYSPSSLVASYPFSEGSGSTTADESGNGHDGTLLNGVSWTTDRKVGNALSFDGMDDYVDCGPVIGATSQFSLEAWVKDNGNSFGSVIGKYQDGYHRWHLLVDSSSVIYWNVSYDGNSYGTSSAAVLQDGQWHHLVMVYDGTQPDNASRLTAYVDGQPVTLTFDGSIPSSIGPLSANVNIGRYNTSNFFSGLIDEVRVYDRALSASEIQDLYQSYSSMLLMTASSLSEDRVPMSVDDKIIEIDGAYIYINVGVSPDLNYGIGDFTVVVKTRTSDAANPGSAGILPVKNADRMSALPGKGRVSHIAVGVRQGKELFLYLDGALQMQKRVGAGKIKRLKVRVGLDDVSTNAVIEDVKLYPYALSSEEIAKLDDVENPTLIPEEREGD